MQEEENKVEPKLKELVPEAALADLPSDRLSADNLVIRKEFESVCYIAW